MPPRSATTGRPRRLPHERRAVRRLAAVSLGEATRVFAKIGLLSFGGPAGQIALMHRVLVDEKRWLDEARFLHALNYCMLLPGPEAHAARDLCRLAAARRARRADRRAAVRAARAPSSSRALSASTCCVGDVPLVQGLLFGLKAAVLAVVLEALISVSKRALKGWAMVALAIAAFVAIAFLKLPFPLIVIGAALCGVVAASRERGGRRTPPTRSRDARCRAGMDAAERAPLRRRRSPSGRRSGCCRSPRCISCSAADTSFRPRRCSSRRWRSSPSAAPMPCSPMSRSRRSRSITGCGPTRC